MSSTKQSLIEFLVNILPNEVVCNVYSTFPLNSTLIKVNEFYLIVYFK